MKIKYIIISPVRNEEKTIEKTILSVINQSLRPLKWLIVDDNSSDKTVDIINEYCSNYPWIECIKNKDVKLNEKGARIATIINTYLKFINEKYDFFSKLDGDVQFDSDFYEKISKAFIINPNLGIASGALTYNGKKEKNMYVDLTRGATKFYRLECFLEIGGLLATTGWDTIDNIQAQQKGWETKQLDIDFEHLKEEGKSQGYFYKYYNIGKYCGKIPYHFWYMILKATYTLNKKPIFFSSLFLFMGYMNTRFINKQRPFPEEVSLYFRSKQYKYVKSFFLKKGYFK